MNQPVTTFQSKILDVVKIENQNRDLLNIPNMNLLIHKSKCYSSIDQLYGFLQIAIYKYLHRFSLHL